MKEHHSRTDYYIKYGVVLLLIMILLLIPENIIYRNEVTLCIFKKITGIPCPFCGMTRASCDILHFRFLSALSYNPLSLFLPLLLLTEIANDIRPGPMMKRGRQYLFILFLISLAALFIVRIFIHFHYLN